MKKISKITSAISLWAIYFLNIKPVFASVVIKNGETVVIDEVKDIWISDSDAAWANLNEFTGALVAGITGLISIIMVGVFSYKAFELAKSSSNPADRQKAIQGLIFSLVAFAILGSISVWITIFTGLLQ